MRGTLETIVGAMFAGKTSELLKRILWAKHQEKKICWRNVTLGYYWSGPNKGKPKRNVGTFYPDLDMVWEKGMEE